MIHIHIIGIAGTFMGSLAALAKEAGYRVTGCDSKVYPPMSTQLAQLGIDVVEGFAAEQLQQYPADIYVIGNVAKRGMPVIEAILNQNLPYTSGPQWLAENILRQHQVLAVSGTHGKTTTASILTWILEQAGLQPGFLIGGVPENFGISARLASGQNGLFVIEADEYDTAFFDKRSKFVHYRPRTAIINNLEFDHADIFADLAAIQTQFHHLIRTIPSDGNVVYNASQTSIDEVLAKGCWSNKIAFADKVGFQAIKGSDEHSFDILVKGQKEGSVSWNLIGEHNRLNALAAIAAANSLGISIQLASQALAGFANVKRRMEIKGVVNNITVYDDFAHHPSAIKTTLDGLRASVGNQRIIAVLEPRSNTMKTGIMKSLLAESLVKADKVFCYAGDIDWDVAAALSLLQDKAIVHQDFDLMLREIIQYARPQDHILIMSNGGFNGIHGRLLSQLNPDKVL